MEGATLNLLKRANTAGKDGSCGLHYPRSATFNIYYILALSANALPRKIQPSSTS